jgi:GH35 family endo-1,4-beta-xylanase
MITELDIKSNGDLQQQATDYAFVYETCIQKQGCKGVMRWDMDEDVSWEQGTHAELFGPKCASKGLDEGVKKVLSTGKAS